MEHRETYKEKMTFFVLSKAEKKRPSEKSESRFCDLYYSVGMMTLLVLSSATVGTVA